MAADNSEMLLNSRFRASEYIIITPSPSKDLSQLSRLSLSPLWEAFVTGPGPAGALGAEDSGLSLLRLRLFSRLGNGFPGAAPVTFPSFDLGTGVLGTGFGGPSPTFGGGPEGGTGVGGLT